MAVIKFGALIDTIKGKVGNAIVQGGRYGSILKVNGINTKSQTPKHNSRQPLRRFALNLISKNWSLMSAGDRTSWGTLIGVWSFINKFGDPFNGTPYMIYSACNLNAHYLGYNGFVTAPPFAAVVDPLFIISDYSLSGDFTTQNQSFGARGQRLIVFFCYPAGATKDINHLPFLFLGNLPILNENVISRKAALQSFPNWNPILGQVFYFKTYTIWATYPKLEFETIYQVNIIA